MHSVPGSGRTVGACDHSNLTSPTTMQILTCLASAPVILHMNISNRQRIIRRALRNHRWNIGFDQLVNQILGISMPSDLNHPIDVAGLQKRNIPSTLFFPVCGHQQKRLATLAQFVSHGLKQSCKIWIFKKKMLRFTKQKRNGTATPRDQRPGMRVRHIMSSFNRLLDLGRGISAHPTMPIQITRNCCSRYTRHTSDIKYGRLPRSTHEILHSL